MYPCQQPKPCRPPVRKICISPACYNALTCKEGGFYVLDKHVVQSNGCRLPFRKTLAFDLSSLDHKKSYELSLVSSTESEAMPCSPYQGHFKSNYLVRFSFANDGAEGSVYSGTTDQSIGSSNSYMWKEGVNPYIIFVRNDLIGVDLGDFGVNEVFRPPMQPGLWNALRITVKNASTGSTISVLNNIISGKAIPSLVTSNAGGTIEDSTFAFGDWSQNWRLDGTLFLGGALTGASEVSFELGQFVHAKLVAPWTDADLFAQLQASGSGLWTVCCTSYETSRPFKEMKVTSNGAVIKVITPTAKDSPTFALPEEPQTHTVILEDQLNVLRLPVTVPGTVIVVLNKGVLGVEVRSSTGGTINGQPTFAIPTDTAWFSVTFQSLGEGNYFVRN